MAEEKEELNIKEPEQTDQNEPATPDPSAPPEKKGSTLGTPPLLPSSPQSPTQLTLLLLLPSGSLLSAPGNFGNTAGEKIQGTLGKVGGPVGKGLETIAGPVGGLIDPLVGGMFRAPETLKNATQESEKVDRHNEELEKPIAGQEQTGSNPLGLNS
ncbi:MAG: hypothetical protein ASARMPRED_000928 [Alectoria sarmentosa]|nr:MAG: hypothetical protein ASARMPRED_000928 [Alectoria sarmentosa]